MEAKRRAVWIPRRSSPVETTSGGSRMRPGDCRAWNHNIHHHPLTLGVLPTPCDRVLAAGCGEGDLAREPCSVVGAVLAIDPLRSLVLLVSTPRRRTSLTYWTTSWSIPSRQGRSMRSSRSQLCTTWIRKRAGEDGRDRTTGGPVVGLARSRRPRDLRSTSSGRSTLAFGGLGVHIGKARHRRYGRRPRPIVKPDGWPRQPSRRPLPAAPPVRYSLIRTKPEQPS